MNYSIRPTTKAVPNERKLVISRELWSETWIGLRVRGNGQLESAAIWAGKREGLVETAEAVCFLDDLFDGHQGAEYHRVSPRALAQLFARLQQDRRVIVADVHTHPDSWVGLSPIDMDHPIEFRPGLHAIVLPSYACGAPNISDAGVHEYLGEGEWRHLPNAEKQRLFIFT